MLRTVLGIVRILVSVRINLTIHVVFRRGFLHEAYPWLSHQFFDALH